MLKIANFWRKIFKQEFLEFLKLFLWSFWSFTWMSWQYLLNTDISCRPHFQYFLPSFLCYYLFSKCNSYFFILVSSDPTSLLFPFFLFMCSTFPVFYILPFSFAFISLHTLYFLFLFFLSVIYFLALPSIFLL